MGLYLQSNFNGENGSENNVKIKQNLQNKKKQGGDGVGREGSRLEGEFSSRPHYTSHQLSHMETYGSELGDE